MIIFFAAKDGEALYSQQKQDQELTVAQIMNGTSAQIKEAPERERERESLFLPPYEDTVRNLALMSQETSPQQTLNLPVR